MRVDTDLVRQLAEMLDETGLTEIEVEDGDRKIHVARKAAPRAAHAPRRRPLPPRPRRRRRRPQRPRPTPPAGQPTRSSRRWSAPSILVGRARRRAVRQGRRQGQGRRDAADHRGDEGDEPDPRARAPARSRQILVENGQPVEFDQPLVVIELSTMPIKKLLIANRGEIALRIHRACHEMGIETVAVHSTADTDAMHVRLADEAICIGPPPATESYLNIPDDHLGRRDHRRRRDPSRLRLPVARTPSSPRSSRAHGIIWIGPKPEHIRMMGDKIEAKRTAAQARPAAGARLRRRGRRRRRGQGDRRARSAIRCSSRRPRAAAGAA